MFIMWSFRGRVKAALQYKERRVTVFCQHSNNNKVTIIAEVKPCKNVLGAFSCES